MKPPRILIRPVGGKSPAETAPLRIPGESIEGTISAIEGDDAVITLADGGKALLPTSDFPRFPTVGDRAGGLYLIDDRAAGAAILTTRTPATAIDPKLVRPGEFIRGSVIEAGRTGVRIRCGDATGFFPSSQLPAGLLRDPGVLLRKEIAGFVTEVNNGELILSLRAVLDRRAKRRQAERIAAFREGDRLTGTIARKTDFGYFVSLGGVDGLLHISRVERNAERRRANGEEPLELAIGQPIEVRIARVEADRGRIGLDLPDPDARREETRAAPTAAAPAPAAPAIVEVSGILRTLSSAGAVVYLEGGLEGWLPAGRFAGHSPRAGELRRFRVLSRDDTGRLELTLQLRGEILDEEDR
jgi:small subunit ribosomal protein S1